MARIADLMNEFDLGSVNMPPPVTQPSQANWQGQPLQPNTPAPDISQPTDPSMLQGLSQQGQPQLSPGRAFINAMGGPGFQAANKRPTFLSAFLANLGPALAGGMSADPSRGGFGAGLGGAMVGMQQQQNKQQELGMQQQAQTRANEIAPYEQQKVQADASLASTNAQLAQYHLKMLTDPGAADQVIQQMTSSLGKLDPNTEQPSIDAAKQEFQMTGNPSVVVQAVHNITQNRAIFGRQQARQNVNESEISRLLPMKDGTFEALDKLGRPITTYEQSQVPALMSRMSSTFSFQPTADGSLLAIPVTTTTTPVPNPAPGQAPTAPTAGTPQVVKGPQTVKPQAGIGTGKVVPGAGKGTPDVSKTIDMALDTKRRLDTATSAAATPNGPNDYDLLMTFVGATMGAQSGARMTYGEIQNAAKTGSLGQQLTGQLQKWGIDPNIIGSISGEDSSQMAPGAFLAPSVRGQMIGAIQHNLLPAMMGKLKSYQAISPADSTRIQATIDQIGGSSQTAPSTPGMGKGKAKKTGNSIVDQLLAKHAQSN